MAWNRMTQQERALQELLEARGWRIWNAIPGAYISALAEGRGIVLTVHMFEDEPSILRIDNIENKTTSLYNLDGQGPDFYPTPDAAEGWLER